MPVFVIDYRVKQTTFILAKDAGEAQTKFGRLRDKGRLQADFEPGAVENDPPREFDREPVGGDMFGEVHHA